MNSGAEAKKKDLKNVNVVGKTAHKSDVKETALTSLAFFPAQTTFRLIW